MSSVGTFVHHTRGVGCPLPLQTSVTVFPTSVIVAFGFRENVGFAKR